MIFFMITLLCLIFIVFKKEGIALYTYGMFLSLILVCFSTLMIDNISKSKVNNYNQENLAKYQVEKVDVEKVDIDELYAYASSGIEAQPSKDNVYEITYVVNNMTKTMNISGESLFVEKSDADNPYIIRYNIKKEVSVFEILFSTKFLDLLPAFSSETIYGIYM